MKYTDLVLKSKLAILFSASCAFTAHADDWNFAIEPYAHAVTIEGDAAIGRANSDNVDVDFDKILETLHMGGMLNLKGIHKSGWGGAIDYAFMDLRDDISTARGGVAAAKIRQAVLQAELVYFQDKGDASLEYLFGLRWWDNDLDLNLDSSGGLIDRDLRKDVDWVDFFVGARYVAPINENWNYMIRGDIGAGDADFTSSVEGGVQYAISDNSLLTVKYKATWVEYEEGPKNQQGYFKYDTATHGPALAYTYKF